MALRNAAERLHDLARNRYLSEFDRVAVTLALDLIESVEIDNTAGNTGDDDQPSRMVLGNVNLTTLLALGFSDHVNREPSGVIVRSAEEIDQELREEEV